MSDPFAVIEFFGGTPNRIRVLRAVCGRSVDRQTLQAETDINRVTLGRILADLQERGWVEGNDEYTATPAGELIAAAFEDLIHTVAAVQDLEDVIEWLPLDGMDVDPRRLADAEVVRPRQNDPQATLRRAYERVRDAEEVAMLSHAFTPGIVDAVHRRVLAGEQEVEMVVSTDVLDIIAGDDEMGGQLRDLLAAADAAVYRYPDDIPHILAIVDGLVSIGVDDDTGRPVALVETDDAAVLEWARSVFERYREGAVRVTPGDLPV